MVYSKFPQEQSVKIRQLYSAQAYMISFFVYTPCVPKKKPKKHHKGSYKNSTVLPTSHKERPLS